MGKAMTAFGKIKTLLVSLLLQRKKSKWSKQGNIFLDRSVLVFPETTLSAYSGKISIGFRSCIRGSLEIQRENGTIEIGNNCYVGDHSRIWAAKSIKIGNNVLIAHNVNIFDNDTHPTDYKERQADAENIIWKGTRSNFSSLNSSPVEIRDDAWIGCNCIILKGVHIGERSIIAAGSVVTKDVPPNTMVAGNPARVIKKISEKRLCS